MTDTKQDNRARGKGSRGPYRVTEPETYIPEYIRLPDGREFKVSQLTKKQRGTRSYNLMHKFLPPPPVVKPKTEHTTDRRVKYTREDIEWMVQVPAEAIAERYGMSIAAARVYKSRMRKKLSALQTPTDTGYILDYTKKT